MNKIKITKQSDYLDPPICAVKPDTFMNFQNLRIDNYFWLKEKENKEVIKYIEAENEYTEEVMKESKNLQNKIYDEILARIKEDNESYPRLDNGYYYYNRTEKGEQYAKYCRKKDSLTAKEEIIFDVNKMAEGKAAYIFTGYSISPDNKLAAYLYNETGSFADYTLKIKDLETGRDLDFIVNGASSMAWTKDSKMLFYTKIDEALRPCKVYKRAIDSKKESLVFFEEDAKYYVGVYLDKYDKYINIMTSSTTTTESYFIPSDKPEAKPKSFMERKKDTRYSVAVHKDGFFIRYKDNEKLNGELYYVTEKDYKDKSKWRVVLNHNEKVLIEGIEVLDDYVIIDLKENGLSNIMLKSINGKYTENISFPEPVYSAFTIGNPTPNSNYFIYSYTSLNRPTTLYKYNIETKQTETVKVDEVPAGFNPDDYIVERLWAKADDGIQVPISLVYKKGLKKNGTNPALIYSYGSYGYSMDVYFSRGIYSLVDRGFVYAVAHIRGGSDLGEKWYEDGKLLKKKNTFTDFIACSEKLIADGYTSAKKLTAMGGSAGGMLVTAIANMRPDLYNSIVAQVPFVDVINTMLDESLPLTIGEYEEWGDPNEEEYFNYMLSYSPYDNISAQDYPNIMVTGGINDSQVLFHEPTKYVAKLRSLKTDDNILVLHMNMDSGHGGATGRYSSIKDLAYEYAFILNRIGIYN